MEPTANRQASNIRSPVYLWIWALLFVLSTFSYLVDYFHLQGYAALGADHHFHAAEGRASSSPSSCTWPGNGWR